MLRPAPFYRRGSFEAGLKRLGYTLAGDHRQPYTPTDVLVIWNRYGTGAQLAERMHAAGGTVVVVENGLVGRDRPDGHWYSLALDDPAHAGGRLAPWIEGEDRLERVGVASYALRKAGREVIVLASRGIGPPGVASPRGWTEETARQVRAQTDRRVRVRAHPGEGPRIPLEQDLADAWCVVTWASAAALQAMLLGVPVFHCCPTWIGRLASNRWSADKGLLEHAHDADLSDKDDRWRALTFERVARGTWRTDEIESGEALARVLSARRSTRSEDTPDRACAASHSSAASGTAPPTSAT